MFPSSVTIWSMLFSPCVRRAYPNTLHAHTLQRDAHWSRVVRDALMSFTVSDLLSDSHIPSLHHCSIVIPLCEGRSIRSCVTELLSDIRAVQMDDPTTSPWPPDKKPSLFVQPSPLLLLFLSYPSLKAQLQLFVTSLKKKVFPRIPCRAISYSLFRAFPKEQEALWCRHISSVPLLCRFSLFLDNRFLPKALRLVESWSHVPAVCLSVCVCERERQRQMWNIAAVNYCCHENVNFFTFLLELSCFRAHYESMVVCTYTAETCRITHTQSVSFHGSCPRTWVITELYDRAQDSLSSSQLIFPINICLCTEEQAAVQLMIRITAACCPTIPTACWEPNSLRGLRSVTHILPHSVLPIPTCISYRHSIGVTLSSNDRCLTPPFFSSVSLLSHSWIPSSSNLFFLPCTILHPLGYPLLRYIHTDAYLPTSLSPIIQRRGVERCLIYNQGGNAPSSSPPPLPSQCEH